MKQLKCCHGEQEGTIVIWMAVLCAICMMIAISIGKIGVATTSVTIAQNAADASALSAAYEIAHSNSVNACDSASAVALKNQATVTSCKYTNEYVEVEVQLKDDEKISAKARAEIG